jgi:hypothetical protein
MASSPTCPTNNNYKQEYLAIKYDYDRQCSVMTDIILNEKIAVLDAKVQLYQTSLDTPLTPATASTPASSPRIIAQKALTDAFEPISQYYSNLISIKKRLNDFLECSSKKLQDANPYSINKERYSERANPKEAVMPRELVFGLFSQLRPSSVPVVMAAGVFMSCLTLLIIFQMFGFTGEIHAPPAVMQGYTWLSTPGTTPLYQNPMVLSGLSIVLGAAVIILGVMYYRSKK